MSWQETTPELGLLLMDFEWAMEHLYRCSMHVCVCVCVQDAPTIEEYLDIFNGPVNVDLDSESVWPMPVPLKF